MNLRTLQIFQIVCAEENITKAASKLYMTQPAVSHAIHDLEKELQIQLFDRYGKRIFLNETGKHFLKRVERVLLSYDELTQHISTLEEEASIRIGSSITIASDRLPNVLHSFRSLYPNTPIHVSVESAKNVMERLHAHDIDIALIEGILHEEECIHVPFSSYDLLVVCSKTNALAKQSILTWGEAAKQTWLLREKGSSVRDTFDSACHLQQIVIEPMWTSVNAQVLLQAVRSDLGITILPEFLINTCPFKEELHILRIEGEQLRNDNHIVYDPGLFLSEPMKQLIKLLQESISDKE